MQETKLQPPLRSLLKDNSGKFRREKGAHYGSYYVRMRDAIKLAVDVYVPQAKFANNDLRLPTVFYMTRYGRSLQLRWPLEPILPTQTTTVWRDEIEYLTRHGYCVVVVDARGTGASGGSRKMEFSDEEAQDGYEVIDWITRQVWSNGEVAINGVSYVGTIGLLIAAKGHPAVKAVVARSAIYDLYEDVAYPGGIHQEKFVKDWVEATEQLDKNNLGVFGKRAKRVVKSIKPVRGASSELYEAIEAHSENHYLGEYIPHITCKDDQIEALHGTIDYYSVKGHVEELREHAMPSLIVSGWYDAAMTHSAFKLYKDLSPNAWLLMGDWNHGRRQNMNPHYDGTESTFPEYDYICHFLDIHLKPSAVKVGVPKVQYYTIGAERWQTALDWPLPQMRYQQLFLDTNAKLNTTATEVQPGYDQYKVNVKVGSGDTSRWDIAFGPHDTRPRGYADRSYLSEVLQSYDTPALDKPLSISGQPYVDLHLSIDTSDGPLFAYLEDVDEAGKVTYITEGMLRLAHRFETYEMQDDEPPTHTYNRVDLQPLTPGEVTRVRMNLIPIAYHLKVGHQLRLSFACADHDHFEQFLPTPSLVNFHRGEGQSSSLFLPVV